MNYVEAHEALDKALNARHLLNNAVANLSKTKRAKEEAESQYIKAIDENNQASANLENIILKGV